MKKYFSLKYEVIAAKAKVQYLITRKGMKGFYKNILEIKNELDKGNITISRLIELATCLSGEYIENNKKKIVCNIPSTKEIIEFCKKWNQNTFLVEVTENIPKNKDWTIVRVMSIFKLANRELAA